MCISKLSWYSVSVSLVSGTAHFVVFQSKLITLWPDLQTEDLQILSRESNVFVAWLSLTYSFFVTVLLSPPDLDTLFLSHTLYFGLFLAFSWPSKSPFRLHCLHHCLMKQQAVKSGSKIIQLISSQRNLFACSVGLLMLKHDEDDANSSRDTTTRTPTITMYSMSRD